jgi:hypothetical protein
VNIRSKEAAIWELAKLDKTTEFSELIEDAARWHQEVCDRLTQQETIVIIEELLAIAKEFINDVGSCDHDVGICVCGYLRTALRAEYLLTKLKGLEQ